MPSSIRPPRVPIITPPRPSVERSSSASNYNVYGPPIISSQGSQEHGLQGLQLYSLQAPPITKSARVSNFKASEAL